MMGIRYLLLCLPLFLAIINGASLSVSNTLGSNMVLQRAPAMANIWGWAAASVGVTVVVGTQKKVTTADANGEWLVTLDPVEAGGPYTITITATDSPQITFENVLFGDVWLCGGQSNMQFTVDSAFNASVEIEAANAYSDIRVFTVGDSHYSSTPFKNLAEIFQNWSVASKASIGVGNWSAFSAVCWFTGRDLYNKYKVPIGLISSNWGGTVIQAWSSPQALKVCNVTASGTGNEANSVLYNAMIVPFLQQVLTGFLWYQGEQNAGQAELYGCMFPAMIDDWRNTWASGKDNTFLFVQLAPCAAGDSSGWPDTREAQLAALKLPKVGYASAIDLGDATSPFGNVHPRDKQDVGKRLSWAAQNIAYGETTVVWEGPTIASAVNGGITGGVAKVTVTFTVPGNGGLVAKTATCPTNEGVPANNCANWLIKLSDNTWVTGVQGAIAGNTVSVTANGVKAGVTITGVSYAYASWPVTTLFNNEGLPAIAFEHLF